MHKGSNLSSAFSTDLSGEACWLGRKVRAWASGHTHNNYDFWAKRGKGKAPLRVVTNQRGYYFQQSEGFDGEKVIELGDKVQPCLTETNTNHQSPIPEHPAEEIERD